jgi:hypothetical protein
VSVTQVSTAPPARHVIVMDEPELELPRQESFTLVSPGDARRSTLRYALGPSRAAVIARTELSSRHLEGAAFTPAVALPATRVGFEVTLAAEPHGQLTLRALPGEAAAASPDAEAYLAPWKALLEGRQITVALDDRGQFTAIGLVDDPGNARTAQAKDELVQRLASTIVPLPAEPVGAGARWRVVTILRQGPAYAKQSASYTLRSATPTAWKLHVVLQRVGEQQSIADPALPPGTTAELVAMVRQLEGDVELDPQQPLIIGGSFTIESRLDVRLQTVPQPAVEQMFEDTGTVTFSRCRPVDRGARPPPARRFGDCPEGFVP